jgi:hypothetical protein
LVRGRIFETSSGIPVLQVPEEDILAVGTTNPLADVATQAHLAARLSNPRATPDRLPKKGTGVPEGGEPGMASIKHTFRSHVGDESGNYDSAIPGAEGKVR